MHSSAKIGKFDKPLVGVLFCRSKSFPNIFGVFCFTMELKNVYFTKRKTYR